MKADILIFTDLDGTLMDHFSYSFEPVMQLLAELRDMDIPVIATTSKTHSELISIRSQIGNEDPFISENGAAVYLPKTTFLTCPAGGVEAGDTWCRQFCGEREKWLGLLQNLPDDMRALFHGFSEMSLTEIQSLTGLDEKQAKCAADRRFGEPILWKGREEDIEEFISHVNMAGGHVLRGGRFLHISGDVNKGDALEWLKSEYEKINPQKRIKTVALGDSPNDLAMLERADYAIVIASPVHPYPKLNRNENVFFSKEYGPEGWNVEIRKLLQKIE